MLSCLMPYKDPAKQRAAKRKWYARQYAEAEFRRAEADRKAEWFQAEEVKKARNEARKVWRHDQKRQDGAAVVAKLKEIEA